MLLIDSGLIFIDNSVRIRIPNALPHWTFGDYKSLINADIHPLCCAVFLISLNE